MRCKQKQIAFKYSNQGLTIIELLVAMVVSLLALGAIYSTFLNQHKSYQVQEETAEMNQNIRAAMYYMQREIRMAGSDPFNVDTFGISAANAGLITFTEDVRGNNPGDPPDGDVADADENITYTLSGTNLMRSNNNVAGDNQIVAQNIDALNFVYLDDTGAPTAVLGDIRSVEITIVARTSDRLLDSPNNIAYINQQGTQILAPQGDNVSRRRLTALIHCRNLGL